MFRFFVLILILCNSACGLSAAAATELKSVNTVGLSRFDLRALPWGNLFYQLDCLAGQGHCSQASYRELWQTLGWQKTDDDKLKQWQILKARYGRQVQLSKTEAMALPGRFDGIRIWDKVRQAAMNSHRRQDLAINLSAILKPADAEQLLQILDAFYPRFEPWWTQSGKSIAESGAKRFAELLQARQSPNLPELIEQASQFYQADLSQWSVLAFNFIARPTGGGDNLNGEQVENQSLVEIKANSNPDSNLDVVIHELCHYFFARMGPTKEKALIDSFVKANTAQAIGAYNLLNEVLATSIGNGLVNQILMPADRFERYVKTEKSFYNDPFIDPVAKALYRRVAQALQQKQSLSDPAFVQDYLKLAQQALGDKLNQPTLLLRTMAAAYEGPEMAEYLNQLQGKLRVGASYGANAFDSNARNLFTDFGAISGVILLKSDQIDRLKDWQSLLGVKAYQELEALAKARKPALYGIKRSAQSYLFVLIAPDSKDFTGLIEKFSQIDQSFEGLSK